MIIAIVLGVKRSLHIIAESPEELLPDASYIDRFQDGMEKHGFRFANWSFLRSVWRNKRIPSLMGIGVYEGYSPNQPVAFIHSVHACENEVDCKYVTIVHTSQNMRGFLQPTYV